MRVLASGSAGVALLVAAGCGGSSEGAVVVASVIPAVAFSDRPVSIAILGGPFRPSYQIDTGSGRTAIVVVAFTAFLTPSDTGGPRVAVDALIWHNPEALQADLPAGLAAGTYDVEVRDPRGQAAIMPRGFTALGHDGDPPTVTITQPAAGTLVAAQTQVAGLLRAGDGPGEITSLRWVVNPGPDPDPQKGDCEIPAPLPEISCTFSFAAPMPTLTVEPMTVRAFATDAAGNEAETEARLFVGLRPTVTSFSPSVGTAAGQTPLTVLGANFVNGTQLLIDGIPADPGGGTIQSTTLIVGRTPPHEPGLVPVSVRTGSFELAAGFFEYVAQPRVRAVSPVSGSIAGGTPVTIAGNDFRPGITRIFFGTPPTAAEILCPRFVSKNRIEGVSPPGNGSVQVVAIDPIAGTGTATGRFLYLAKPPDTGDGGTPPPPCGAGP